VASDLQPLDFPLAYRGLTLNRHRSAAGAEVSTYRTHTIRVDRFDFSRLQMRDQREPRNLISGGDLGDATETFRYISVGGTILAPSGSELQDYIGLFVQSFDIEECQIASPSTRGLHAFTYTVPTDIAAYSPYQLERLMARPAGFPVIFEGRSRGFTRSFALELVCEDPRRYRDTATTVVLNSGNGFSAACPNWNANVGRYVYPVITVLMAGAGAATFTLSDGTKSLVLTLVSTVNADSITIEPEFGTIKKNGAHAAALRTSAVDSFFGIPRNGATIAATNTTNVTSVTISYREARA
jgi:hypothetical protein